MVVVEAFEEEKRKEHLSDQLEQAFIRKSDTLDKVCRANGMHVAQFENTNRMYLTER